MRLRTVLTVAAALAFLLLVAVAFFGIFWLGWDWKALIGWSALVDYINPKNATGRKDAVQVYAVIVAGVIASITAAVSLLNLGLTRRSLTQQRDLEAQRAQGTALQTYYEQIGELLTEHDLRNTKREEIRQLARGQTLTVLQEIDASRKRSLLAFLHDAELIRTEKPAISLTYADFQGADLQEADLFNANLFGVVLFGVNLQGAILTGADLRAASLQRADLREAELLAADLQGAKVTDEQLAATRSLLGATMPDGQKYEDSLKDKEGSRKDVENE